MTRLSAANPLAEKASAYEETKRNRRLTGCSGRQENPLMRFVPTVPQTDTGRQVEDTKACEITLVKELGKLTP